MKYVDEFRNKESVRFLVDTIAAKIGNRPVTFMEVCGTHTMSIAQFGIRQLLPENIRLISGPGCPVCVTPMRLIDQAIAIGNEPDVIITTFGDMLRVPGSSSSFEQERSGGAEIKVVMSTLDALRLAEENPKKQVVFIGVGFETTIPTVAVAIRQAKQKNLSNFSVLCAHKTMPLAMGALCEGDVQIDGFLCPGHVSTITGTGFYHDLVDKYGIGCVIAGFEPLDILQGIRALCDQSVVEKPGVENQYTRSVVAEGNPQALAIIDVVFEPCDSVWRGLGVIPGSGLQIRSGYSEYDAALKFDVKIPESEESGSCRCGEILTGRILPQECGLFGNQCTPEDPVGACMVSGEGTCAATYKYEMNV